MTDNLLTFRSDRLSDFTAQADDTLDGRCCQSCDVEVEAGQPVHYEVGDETHVVVEHPACHALRVYVGLANVAMFEGRPADARFYMNCLRVLAS
jgi:hypothetical protein